MRNTAYFKNKKVTIVGLARSGLAAANLLFDLEAEVSITDNKDSQSVRLNASKLKSASIKTEFGKHSEGFIRGSDLVVVSPGVAENAVPILLAKELGIPIISEIELSSFLCQGKIIAVTGSSGKTTVTTLIGQILKAAGKNVFVCGNIGDPFSGEVAGIKENDYVALEVSSFQLETIEKFKPKISLILNISRNHLDRYRCMEDYVEAKKRIFMNQDNSDFLVLNYADQSLRAFAKESKAEVKFFYRNDRLNPNQAAVMSVGKILGIDDKLIRDVFNQFKGIEHRQEFVTEINQVKFINDSKATTAESAMWALENINNPVILIAGGRDKGVDYSIILDLARKKVKEAILIGEAKDIIASALKDFLSLDTAESLGEAVRKAYQKAAPGDCVLLSPMCSSFDMFSGYEERGRSFKEAVFALAKNN